MHAPTLGAVGMQTFRARPEKSLRRIRESAVEPVEVRRALVLDPAEPTARQLSEILFAG